MATNDLTPEQKRVKKYIVRPGYMVSENDCDRHFIRADDLIRLYGLRDGEYVIYDERQRYPDSWELLGPMFHYEDYSEKRKQIAAVRALESEREDGNFSRS